MNVIIIQIKITRINVKVLGIADVFERDLRQVEGGGVGVGSTLSLRGDDS